MWHVSRSRLVKVVNAAEERRGIEREMSIRGVWVFARSADEATPTKVLFSRYDSIIIIYAMHYSAHSMCEWVKIFLIVAYRSMSKYPIVKTVLFPLRRYATVERRAQVFAGKRYCAIPSDGELAAAIGSLSSLPGHPDQVHTQYWPFF